jgi:arginyl-tRNA synthetase
MSLSRLLEHRGHVVTRSTALSDWGLHIAHAAAGFESTLPDDLPTVRSSKSDHLVGAWYELGCRQTSGGESLRARELLHRADNDDPYARLLLTSVTELAKSGILMTLARLGIDFTQIYYESVGMPAARALIEAAVAKGMLHRRPDGSIYAVARTQTSPHELTFVRSDGSLLVYAQWLGVHVNYERDSPGVWRLNLAGAEWDAGIAAFADVRRHLGYRSGDPVLYGMITVDGRKLGSRNGPSLTIDGELDDLAEQFRRYDPEGVEEFHEWLAVAALKLYVLSYPRKKKLPYDPSRAFDVGRRLCRILELTDPSLPSLPSCSSHDAHGRFGETESSVYKLLLLIDTYPSVVARATRLLDPSVIVRFLYELESLLYPALHHEPSVCVALHDTLRATVAAALSLLGMEPAPDVWEWSRGVRRRARRGRNSTQMSGAASSGGPRRQR